MPPGSRYSKHQMNAERVPGRVNNRALLSSCAILLSKSTQHALWLSQTPTFFLTMTTIYWLGVAYPHLILTTLLHHAFISISQRRKLGFRTMRYLPKLIWLAGEGQDVKVHTYFTKSLCFPNCSKSLTSKNNCLFPKMEVAALCYFFSLATLSTHYINIFNMWSWWF